MSDSELERLVFVSHASEDTWVAKQIAREITLQGALPFLDEAEVEIGAEFEEDIRDFLNQADELLVLFTPWALKRPYVWAEIGAAWIRRIPITVVLHGLTRAEFQSQPSTPVFLKKRNIIQLNAIDEYFNQLKKKLSDGKRYD